MKKITNQETFFHFGKAGPVEKKLVEKNKIQLSVVN